MSRLEQLPNHFTRFSALKPVELAGPEDTYCINSSGKILQRKVSFNSAREPSTSWVPYQGGGFCQQPSQAYVHLLEQNFDDPRSAASNGRGIFGDPRKSPEERS